MRWMKTRIILQTARKVGKEQDQELQGNKEAGDKAEIFSQVLAQEAVACEYSHDKRFLGEWDDHAYSKSKSCRLCGSKGKTDFANQIPKTQHTKHACEESELYVKRSRIPPLIYQTKITKANPLAPKIRKLNTVCTWALKSWIPNIAHEHK